MSKAEEIEKEFIEGIGKLKKGSWGNDNSEIDEALNAGYKQGISDVQIMLRGEFVDDLTFTTAKEFAEAHTNQTLQEIRDDIEEISRETGDPKLDRGYRTALIDVLNKINEKL